MGTLMPIEEDSYHLFEQTENFSKKKRNMGKSDMKGL